MATALRIEQKQFLKPWNRFELLPSGELLVSTKGRGGLQEVRVDLSALNPKTARFSKSGFGSLVALIVFVAIYVGAVGTIAYNLRHDPDAGTSIPAISVITGAVMLPLMWTALTRWRNTTYDVTVFYNRWNSQAAVSISNQVPDPATAKQFITEMAEKIEKATPIQVRGDGLVDQLARLSELHTKGILSAEEFAAAKQRLLKDGLEEKRIGF